MAFELIIPIQEEKVRLLRLSNMENLCWHLPQKSEISEKVGP